MINYFWRCHAQNILLATVLSTVACTKGSVKVDKADEPAQTNATDACKDPDLNQIAKGQKVILCDGSTAEGLLGKCSGDGQVDCIAAAEFPAIDKQKIDSSDIRYGKTILGLTGTHRDIKQCRNAAHLATLDASGVANFNKKSTIVPANRVNDATDELNWSPSYYSMADNLPIILLPGIGGSTPPGGLQFSQTYYVIASGGQIKLAEEPGGAPVDITSQGTGKFMLSAAPNGDVDVWDTLDDYNAGLSISPSSSPWSATHVCDDSNFTDVSSAGLQGLAPSNTTPSGATAAFSQIWRDELSGLYFTNLLNNGSTKLGWGNAMSMCSNLDSGDGAGNWRIPTQKELLQLYIDGVSRLSVAGGSWDNLFIRSSTAASKSINSTWRVNLAEGESKFGFRLKSPYGVICVR